MAFFAGLFALIIIIFAASNARWIDFGLGKDRDLVDAGTGRKIEVAYWGLWKSTVVLGDEAVDNDPEVKIVDRSARNGPAVTKSKRLNTLHPPWMETWGAVLTCGLITLGVALIVVFFGLCMCCTNEDGTGCINGGAGNKLLRFGMYLYLLADLTFFVLLIYFFFKLYYKENNPDSPTDLTIDPPYGAAWGAVILVFMGAILLLLDKQPGSKKEKPDDVESERLLVVNNTLRRIE